MSTSDKSPLVIGAVSSSKRRATGKFLALFRAIVIRVRDFFAHIVALQEVKGHHFIGIVLNPSSLVLDLGTNTGKFAAAISARYGARIIGVEPIKSLYDMIPAMDNATFLNCAMAPRDGPVTLFLSTNPESHSVNPLVARGANAVDPLAKKTCVEGVTLASLRERFRYHHIDLLKLDIEGAEIDVLASAPDAFLLEADQISVEFHDNFDRGYAKAVEAIKLRLKRLGFVCMTMSPLSNEDVLFVHKRLARRLGAAGWIALMSQHYIFMPLKRFWTKHIA